MLPVKILKQVQEDDWIVMIAWALAGNFNFLHSVQYCVSVAKHANCKEPETSSGGRLHEDNCRNRTVNAQFYSLRAMLRFRGKKKQLERF